MRFTDYLRRFQVLRSSTPARPGGQEVFTDEGDKANREAIRALADFIDNFDFTYNQGDVPEGGVLRDLYWIEARNMAPPWSPPGDWKARPGGEVAVELSLYGRPGWTRWAGSYDTHRETVRLLAECFTVADAWEHAQCFGERPEHGLEVYELELVEVEVKPDLGYFIHRGKMNHEERCAWLDVVMRHQDEIQELANRAIERARAA